MHIVERFTPRVATVLLFMLSGCACAEEPQDNWDFTGFATVSYTNTDKYDDRIPRRSVTQSGSNIRDNGFLLDSRLGIQSHWQIDDHWDFTFQAVAREQLANRLQDYVDIFYASYRADNEWQFGIGRQAFDLFFMSEYHNTGYSYDWVRPPTEFYGTMPYHSFDGLKISRSWGDFDSSWRWRFSVGNIESKFNADVLVTSGDIDSSQAKPIYSTELSWQNDTWQLRGSYAHMEFKHELGNARQRDSLGEEVIEIQQEWPEFAHIVADFTRGFVVRMASLGARWESDGWKLQSEWSTVSSDVITFDGQRAYFHVSKRIDKWLPFATFGWARDNSNFNYTKPDPQYVDLVEFYDAAANYAMNMRHNQRSLSVGLRWDFSSRKALKTQCDRFFFEAGSGSIDGRVDLTYPNNETRTWCSVSLDVVF